MSRWEQPKPLLLKHQDASEEKKTTTHSVFAKWVFHAEGFCCSCSPGSWEFTVRSSGSCATNGAREQTGSLRAQEMQWQCCLLLERGAEDWCVGTVWLGVCKAAAPGSCSHGPGPHCPRRWEKDKARPFSKSSQLVLLLVQSKDEVFFY